MKDLVRLIRESVGESYDLEDLGSGDYLVHTGKYFDDGDELHIVLKVQGDGYELTDEGHTLMWLSYEDYNFTPLREALRDGIIEQNQVRLDNGRICASVDNISEIGEALSCMEQAVIQIAGMRHLSRSNVASTFLDDIRASYLNSSLGTRCDFRKVIQSGDDTIEPDVYIDAESPVLVFAVNNSERAKETFINLIFARNSGKGYRTVVVISDEADISRKDHKRLINTADRPIEGLENMVKMTEEYVNA